MPGTIGTRAVPFWDAPGALGLAFGIVCALLEGSDVCFAPVLSIAEAAAHPHNATRGVYSIDANGAVQATAAPRFLPLSTE